MPKKLILAVDDNPAGVGALRQILIQKGYEVATAMSGEEALEFLAKRVPDLVLLDVAMPGLSGYDVCRKIREDPRTASVPVIFLTGKGGAKDMKEGKAAGSDLYLTKPILATRLTAMLEMFLTEDKPISRRPKG